MSGNYTELQTFLGPNEAVGAISNSDVLLVSATVLSLAVFLPASRDGGAVYFGTDSGKKAFTWILASLFAAILVSAFSTVLSFVVFCVALIIAIVLGYKALKAKENADEALDTSEQAITRARQGRPANVVPAAAQRCAAATKTGKQCRNTMKANGFCRIHASLGAVPASVASL